MPQFKQPIPIMPISALFPSSCTVVGGEVMLEDINLKKNRELEKLKFILSEYSKYLDLSKKWAKNNKYIRPKFLNLMPSDSFWLQESIVDWLKHESKKLGIPREKIYLEVSFKLILERHAIRSEIIKAVENDFRILATGIETPSEAMDILQSFLNVGISVETEVLEEGRFIGKWEEVLTTLKQISSAYINAGHEPRMNLLVKRVKKPLLSEFYKLVKELPNSIRIAVQGREIKPTVKSWGYA